MIMPLKLSNLRSVLAQVNGGGGKSLNVSRRSLSTTARRRNLYYSRSIYESGDFYYNGFISFTAGLTSVVVWELIQLIEYSRTMQRDIEEHAGLESKTPLRNFLRDAWRDLYVTKGARRFLTRASGFTLGAGVGYLMVGHTVSTNEINRQKLMRPYYRRNSLEPEDLREKMWPELREKTWFQDMKKIRSALTDKMFSGPKS